jgi:hypothetical protein
MGKFIDFLNEAFDPVVGDKIRQAGEKWRNSPQGGMQYMIGGYTVLFSPTELTISKDGEVIWRKPGDFSHPTKIQFSGAKTKVAYFANIAAAKRTGIADTYWSKRAANESAEQEQLDLPAIEVGDSILTGKFKNRKATVTGFGKDKHGQPILHTTKGDQQLFKPRIAKLMKTEEDAA